MTPHQKHLQDAAKRADRVRELAKQNLTHEQIAAKVKLTRQRVGQILAEPAK